MNWLEIQTYLIGVAATFLTGVITTAMAKWVGIKKTEETRAAVTWALEQGVAYAALRLKNAAGPQKKDAALSVAASIAPKAIGKLDEGQKSALVEATYARMKPSLPGSVFSMKGEDIPIDIVDMGGVRPLPAPSRVPRG